MSLLLSHPVPQLAASCFVHMTRSHGIPGFYSPSSEEQNKPRQCSPPATPLFSPDLTWQLVSPDSGSASAALRVAGLHARITWGERHSSASVFETGTGL